jgi:OHCU decarboxylase
MTIDEVNEFDLKAFIEKVGWVFERSPWVAERAWDQRPFADRQTLHGAMTDVMWIAKEWEQIALLRAHPDLGSRTEMSEASVNEQSGAGLDRLMEADIRLLTRMNSEYKEKFGFPFLYAVKGANKIDILAALARRLPRSRAEELQEALTQVTRIAGFRLEDLINGTVS